MPGSTGGRDRRRRARPADRWVLPGRARHVVAVAVTAVVLTGCGGTSEPPVTLAPLTGSPSGTPTPSPTASTTPSASGEDAAIEAAVRAYYSAMDVALSTGDVNPYLAATTTSCECRRFAQTVEAAFAEGEIVDGGLELIQVTLLTVRGTSATAAAVYETPDYTVERGGQVDDFTAQRLSSRVRLAKDGATWRVQAEDLIESVPL